MVLDALEIAYASAWARRDLPGALDTVGQGLALGPEKEEGALHEWERRRPLSNCDCDTLLSADLESGLNG